VLGRVNIYGKFDTNGEGVPLNTIEAARHPPRSRPGPELHRGLLQGVAGNKKGEFEVETQFLSKLHTNNA
jgi:hypothetical protein